MNRVCSDFAPGQNCKFVPQIRALNRPLRALRLLLVIKEKAYEGEAHHPAGKRLSGKKPDCPVRSVRTHEYGPELCVSTGFRSRFQVGSQGQRERARSFRKQPIFVDMH